MDDLDKLYGSMDHRNRIEMVIKVVSIYNFFMFLCLYCTLWYIMLHYVQEKPGWALGRTAYAVAETSSLASSISIASP